MVPVNARLRAAAIAIAGRTPSRTAMRTATPTVAAAAVADRAFARQASDAIGIRLKALPTSE